MGSRRHRRERLISEYQYYEFQAIDRPLTVEEMREPAHSHAGTK